MLTLRRSVLLVAATALLSVAAPAVAAAPVAPVLKGTLAKLKARTKLPILLPSTLPVDRGGRRLYPTISTDAHSYGVDLGLAPGCGGANVCSVGFLGAVKTAKAPSSADGSKVRLHGGASGRYRGLSCGASCSPPSITFRSAGVNTTYQLKLDLAQGQTDRSALTRLANEALDAGPR